MCLCWSPHMTSTTMNSHISLPTSVCLFCRAARQKRSRGLRENPYGQSLCPPPRATPAPLPAAGKNEPRSSSHSEPHLGVAEYEIERNRIKVSPGEPDLGSPGEPALGSESVSPGRLFSAPPHPPGLSLVEAFASWQWYNYLVSKVPAGKQALVINMNLRADIMMLC